MIALQQHLFRVAVVVVVVVAAAVHTFDVIIVQCAKFHIDRVQFSLVLWVFSDSFFFCFSVLFIYFLLFAARGCCLL